MPALHHRPWHGHIHSAVDGEPQSINLLLGIERITFVVERPVNSTKFIVIETVDKSAFGTRSRFQILRPPQQAVCSRKGPQDAGVQDGPLFSSGFTSSRPVIRP
mgnify:CR=1 FL=1